MFGFGKKRSKAVTYWHIENATYWEQGQMILDQAHVLIAGTTGSGKSTLIHKLMWTALSRTPARTQFILADLKAGLELGRYARLPHTIRFARTAEDALSALDYAIEIMDSRCEQMYKSGEVMWNGSDVYVVIDELGFLLQQCESEALKRLARISRLGRAARIHLLLATQSPNRGKMGIPAVLQQNMTCCVGLKCKTAIESRQIIGLAGCEGLPRYGTAYVTIGPDLYLLPITPESDDVYRERIAYWMSDKCKVTE